MAARADNDQIEDVRRERDLYLRLLELGSHQEIEPFLERALALVVEVTGADQGYLELRDDHAPAARASWSVARGLSAQEIEGVRLAISRGIIAEAIATGQTIETPSALLDPRFSERESVQLGKISAVLCAPIGSDPPLGVLYLQGRAGSGPFAEDDRDKAEVFARHLAPLADRLLVHHRIEPDATAAVRAKLRLDGFIGHSRALAAVLQQVALVAPLEINVLLTGESGTGKSQLARLIHDNGPRAGQPFVDLNCAAFQDSLLESELFGALKGSHSGADRDRPGKVAAAEHGTLFLDEVGDLSLPAQAKLLHLLQSREYYPLGAPKPIKADVRILAATNVDLEKAVVDRRFREDLFYRLQVLPLRIPSLAERREDVAPLAVFFGEESCTRHGFARVALSSHTLRAAQTADWPGNVRQLAHAIEAAVIRATGEGAAQVELRHLFPNRPAEADPTTSDGPAAQGLTFQEATRRFQIQILRENLETSDWNVSEVARRLDLARSHVYNLIRAFGLERTSAGGTS